MNAGSCHSARRSARGFRLRARSRREEATAIPEPMPYDQKTSTSTIAATIMTDMSFSQVRVAISGGSRGIGLTTARLLRSRGATVVCGDLEPGEGDLALDVRDAASWAAFLDAAGPLDVLVNNAGVMPLGRFAEEDNASTRRQLAVNLEGVVLGTRAVLPGMTARGRGHVVNIASMGGRIALPGAATYSATKAGVIVLGEALRRELRGTGVEITTVLPAMVDTGLAGGIPRGRGLPMVTPARVAEAIAAAIERPRRKVYVPEWMRAVDALQGLVPAPAMDLLRGAMDDMRAVEKVDAAGRAGYEERVAGT